MFTNLFGLEVKKILFLGFTKCTTKEKMKKINFYKFI